MSKQPHPHLVGPCSTIIQISLPSTDHPREDANAMFKPRMGDPDKSGNSFLFTTDKKQTTNFSSANFQKLLSPNYIILRIQRLEGKHGVDLDEVAHYEPPHQHLRCLLIQLFPSLIL